MKRLNILFSLTSLTVLLVTIERFSFTTHIILQPYNFLRLHEAFQMTVLILLTVIIPFFILKEVSNNFRSLQSKKGRILGAIFITGIYFYATGNGLHEIASYYVNSFCDPKHLTTLLCHSLFFNDYYTGNIVYFVGAALFTSVLLIFERNSPRKDISKSGYILLFFNSIMYAFTIFAYAGFDIVLVGLVYGVVMSIVSLGFLLTTPLSKKFFPFTVYTTTLYLIGTLGALFVRLIR